MNSDINPYILDQQDLVRDIQCMINSEKLQDVLLKLDIFPALLDAIWLLKLPGPFFYYNYFGWLLTGMSKNDLLEMQRIMRERQQEDYKKKAGMKLDESKGVRYQTIQ